MAAKQTVEMQFLTNAKMMLGELRLVNAEMHNIRLNTEKTGGAHTKAAVGAKKHSSAMAGLALRFVGYNLVLNQVMGAQQKLIQYIQESVKSYREFETRLAEISTILGTDQIPLMERLKIGIEHLSVSYGQATSDMSKGMYDILSAAFSAEKALTLLTVATKASIAGLSDIRTSTDIFTTVLNTYGKQVEQATNVSNILFQSVVRGKFQFQDLEQALGYVVPIAAQAGIQFKELMAALSTATRHGLHLDMTSRGLALAIQGIVNPSVKATKAAEEYGIEMSGLALRVMGLHGWFEKLNEATKEYGTSILGELIPNMRSLRVAMVLAGDVGLGGFNQDLVELAKMGNSTEIALNKIMDTSQFVSNQLAQQWEQTKREVGEDWDEMLLDIQRGILVIADHLRGKEYISRASAEYDFIDDDIIHNASEYLRIAEDIAQVEKERSILRSVQKPERDLLGQIGDYLFGEIDPWADELEELDADFASLVTTQQEFKDGIGEIVGGIRDEIDSLGDLELTLMNIELAVTKLEDVLVKTFVYGFKDAAGGMKEASININELTTLTQEQRDALSKLGDTIQGNLAYQYMALHAQREYADATHDVSTGLKIANQVYKEIPNDIAAAVNAVREYTKAQKDNRKATQQMTAAMRKHQIQLLEIQLMGMIRRRGLTRMEERRIKEIQIIQAKARLENMKGQKNALESDVTTYQTSQQLIDDYLFKIKEKQYELKYTYDQQVTDLETAISREGEKLLTRYDWWETTNQKIIDTSTDLITTLNEIMEEPILMTALIDYGMEIDAIKEKIISLLKVAEGRAGIIPDLNLDTDDLGLSHIEPDLLKPDLLEPEKDTTPRKSMMFYDRIGRFLANTWRDMTRPMDMPKLATGIDYVPQTMPAILHKGEAVIPAGKKASSGVTIGSVTIQVQEIADISDVDKLSSLLSLAESSGRIKNGQTKYRLR